MVDAPEIRIDPLELADKHFSTGQALTEMDRIILDRVRGNGDGSFDQRDMDKMEADRNDTAFLGGVRAVGSAAVEFGVLSVGAAAITHAPIMNTFEDAAFGRNVAPEPQFAQNFGLGGPGNSSGMDLGMNLFAPKAPTGFGGA